MAQRRRTETAAYDGADCSSAAVGGAGTGTVNACRAFRAQPISPIDP
jgi:hypothetical protein